MARFPTKLLIRRRNPSILPRITPTTVDALNHLFAQRRFKLEMVRTVVMESRSHTKHPLRSGIPCVTHRCVRCCIETSMSLSVFDVTKIVKRGYDLSDFTIKADGGRQLKNIAGRCVFLSENGCTIYPYRPEGCQLYPLMYDEARRKAVIDHLCPYAAEFDVTKEDIAKLKHLLGRLGM